MGKTLIQKLLEQKTGKELQCGDVIEVSVDLVWGCEMGVKWALDRLREMELPLERISNGLKKNADKIKFVFDHLTPTNCSDSNSTIKDLKEFAREYGIEFFDTGYNGGIQHRVLEERGYLGPGMVGVGADSHSCTGGALGAVTTGIGSTDLACAMTTGKTWMKVPESILINLTGKPRKYVTGKDIILRAIAELGESGARYNALEFSGDGIAHLDMASRFTIANMSVEAGAKFGLFPTDQTTIDYLREIADGEFGSNTFFDKDNLSPIKGDTAAKYKKVLTLHTDMIEPMVALPYSPVNALGIHQLNHILKNPEIVNESPTLLETIATFAERLDQNGSVPVQQIFIGSCTNGRIEDLRIAAEILKGKKVADQVRVIIIPASQQVFRQAECEGLIRIFLEAGCHIESASCGPCIGFKSGVLGKNETAIFTSNQNFYGRNGDQGSMVLLSGPAVAAASALAGKLVSPADIDDCYYSKEELFQSIRRLIKRERSSSKKNGRKSWRNAHPMSMKEAKPELETFRTWCFGDNINTDLIIPAKYYRTPELQEYKKYFLQATKNDEFLNWYMDSHESERDILVGGKNFGYCSSKENAPVEIKKAGVPYVIAHSFARTFYRNALNIGLPLLEIGEAAYRVNQGDKIAVDIDGKTIFNITKGEKYRTLKPTTFQLELIRYGGLLAYMESRL